jgi:hypothetical protein
LQLVSLVVEALLSGDGELKKRRAKGYEIAASSSMWAVCLQVDMRSVGDYLLDVHFDGTAQDGTQKGQTAATCERANDPRDIGVL